MTELALLILCVLMDLYFHSPWCTVGIVEAIMCFWWAETSEILKMFENVPTTFHFEHWAWNLHTMSLLYLYLRCRSTGTNFIIPSSKKTHKIGHYAKDFDLGWSPGFKRGYKKWFHWFLRNDFIANKALPVPRWESWTPPLRKIQERHKVETEMSITVLRHKSKTLPSTHIKFYVVSGFFPKIEWNNL